MSRLLRGLYPGNSKEAVEANMGKLAKIGGKRSGTGHAAPLPSNLTARSARRTRSTEPQFAAEMEDHHPEARSSSLPPPAVDTAVYVEPAAPVTFIPVAAAKPAPKRKHFPRFQIPKD